MPWKTLGQGHLIARLQPALEQGRESHAYLLTGPPHVGKLTLAREIAQAVNCLSSSSPTLQGGTIGGEPCDQCVQCQRVADGLHADVRVVDLEFARMVEGRNTVTTITIDAIREMERTVNLNPFEGSRSVIIIDGAGAMTPEASNALLKTLEEPPPGVLFLLLADDEETLLPTIRSRCQAMRLLPMSRQRMIDYLAEQHGITEDEADRLYRLSRGCLGWALTALADPQILDQRQADLERMRETLSAGLDTRFGYANEVASLFGSNRPAARELLALWLRWWRDLLLVKEGADEYLHNADHADVLRAHAETLTTAQIAAFIRRLLSTITALDANANPRLALETLMLNVDN